MSTRLRSSKSSTNGLNIVDKFSFRGRRKLNTTISVENETDETEIKQPKTDDSVSEEVKVNKKQKAPKRTKQPSSKPTSSTLNLKTTKRKITSNHSAVISSDNSEIDIENCDKTLINNSAISKDKVKWFPNDWEEMLKNIQEMRKNQSAPVDDMGCHKTMDENSTPKVRRFQALVSLMLSSQTKDQVTYATMLKLREHGLTVDNIMATEESKLTELIKSVGFFRTKAKHIKLTTKILQDEYDGDIPDSVDKMLKLPGVGPKMAHLCMTTAWGKVHGIGVDTHVHRISNRLKWVKKETKTPEQTRIALESWLPPSLWYEVNHLMVGFGQTICLPRNPKCSGCLNNNICPVGRKELKGLKRTSS